MKFSIRDLLWLTVVGALVLGWWLDHRNLRHENRDRIKDVNNWKALYDEAKYKIKPA